MTSIGEVRATLTLNDKLTGALTRAASHLDQTGKKMQRVGQQMSDAGSKLTTSMTVPIVALGGLATKAASDFESSFAGVRKTVDATEEQFAELSDGMRDLAKEIPANVNELNRIGEAAGQLGIETENILSFTRTMFDLGITTNLSSDRAATALARLANITGLPQTQFDRLGSTIVGLGNTFATTEAEIVDFGLRIAAAGDLAGLSEAQILGIGAAMSSVGVEAEAGGTAVQKVLLKMVDAVAQGGDSLATFAATAGQSASEFAEAFETNASAAFQAFVEGLGRQGNAAFQTLEKLELQDNRLIRSFLSLANAGDLLSRTMAEGTKAFAENVALAEEAAKRYETFGSRLTVFWNRLRDVAITLGDALIPVFDDLLDTLQPLIEMLTSLAQGFAELPSPIRKTAVAVTGLVAAIGPLLFVVGNMIDAWATLTVSSPRLAAGILSLGGPLGVIALAVGGVTLAVSTWRSHLETQISLMSNSIEATNKYGMAINALRAELADAASSQRDLDRALIEGLGTNLQKLKLDLEASKEKLARLHEEARGGPWSGLGNLIKGTNSQIREQTKLVEAQELQFKTYNELLNKAVERGFKPLNKATDDASQNSNRLSGSLDVLTEAQQKFLDSIQAVETDLSNQIEMFNLQERASRAVGSEVVKLQSQLILLNIAQGLGVDVTNKHVQSLEGLATKLVATKLLSEQFAALHEKSTARLKQQAAGQRALANSMGAALAKSAEQLTQQRALAAAWEEGAEAVERLNNPIRQMAENFALTLGESHPLVQRLQQMADEYDQLGESISKAMDQQRAVERMRDAFSVAIADMVVNAEDFGEALEAIFVGETRRITTEFVGTILDGFNEVDKNMGNFFKAVGSDGLGAALSKLKDGFGQAFKGIKDGAKDAFNNLGKSGDAVTVAFAAATGDWASMGIAALTAVSKFAQGDWVGGMIAAVGVVVGAFKKLFGSGKSLGQKIEEAFEALNDGVATVQDFNAATNILLETFDRVARGLNSVEGGSKVLIENFESFFEAAQKMGDAGVEAIAKVVEAARAAGVDLEIINEKLADTLEEANQVLEDRNNFLLDQSRTIVESVESLFDGLGRVTRREVQFATTSVLQAFNAMQAAGMPLLAILNELQNAFGLISERAGEIGLELPEAFTRFGEMLELLSNTRIKNLIGRLEEVAAVAQAAGNMGLLTADQFDVFGDRVDRAFRKLIRQGLSSEEAIAALAPQLQLLSDLAEQYGFELDNNTQRLLDQAIAQGVVTEQGLTTEDILIKGFDNMLRGLNALIEALGGVPLVFDEIGQTASDTTDSIVDDFETIADSGTSAMDEIVASAHGMAHQLSTTLNNIPVSFDVQGVSPNMVISAQHGTGTFMDFGAGTPAILHGNEQVITEAEGRSVADMVASAIRTALSRSESGGESGPLSGDSSALANEISGLREDVNRIRRDWANRLAAGGDRKWGRG